MKASYLLICSLLLGFACHSLAQKRDVCFFMVHKFVGPDANLKSLEGLDGLFYTYFSNKLKESFPCAFDNDDKSIGTLLGHEREKQLLGSGADEALKSIADAYNIDYLISLELGTMMGGLFSVSATCTPYRTKEKIPIIRAFAHCPYNETAGGEMISKCEEVATKIIDGLKKIEICPFIGPVSISINSVIDSTSRIEYGVYCNGSDQQYLKEEVTKKNTLSEWKLIRKGIPRTGGTMTFYTNESIKTTEEDGCHKCKSGREGGLITKETRSIKMEGTGISHESVYNNMPQEDTRIELEFLKDGTYLIIAKGTSLPAKGEEKVEISAEGTCDNITPQTKSVPREIRVPLKVIFGPYTGKATDKLLQEKDEKKVKNPVNNEEQTITIDFSLKQKEN